MAREVEARFPCWKRWPITTTRADGGAAGGSGADPERIFTDLARDREAGRLVFSAPPTTATASAGCSGAAA
ncbi:MAG: hypothetical protein HPM95_13370 [Alphaproteobacteria bacterium]|nr:hypothetical protein [Alphaproteobacteria bacterium]